MEEEVDRSDQDSPSQEDSLAPVSLHELSSLLLSVYAVACICFGYNVIVLLLLKQYDDQYIMYAPSYFTCDIERTFFSL